MPLLMQSLLNDPDPWKAPDPLPGPIETERLVLRAYEHGDAAALLEALDSDRNALLPWIVWVRTDNRTLAECHYSIEMFRRAAEAPGCTDFTMGIFDRVTGAVVGGTGLHRIRAGQRDAEIGYWVRSDRRGQGIATEATAALLTAGFAPQAAGGWGFRRITILCAAENLASAAVPGKLGMRLEVRARKERYMDGVGYYDLLGFALLADEWDPAARRARPGIGAGLG